MITDLDNNILITTQHDAIQEAELTKAAKHLMLCYDAFWNDHFYGEQARLYFSLASIRCSTRRNQEYCHLSFDLFSYEFQKYSRYDLRDFDKALQLIHNRLDRILEIVDRNYSKDYYLKFMENRILKENEQTF